MIVAFAQGARPLGGEKSWIYVVFVLSLFSTFQAWLFVYGTFLVFLTH